MRVGVWNKEKLASQFLQTMQVGGPNIEAGGKSALMCKLGLDDEINFAKISFLSHSHIPDRKTGLELAEKYGIDGVMIGRGIFHNPFAFEKNHANTQARNY